MSGRSVPAFGVVAVVLAHDFLLPGRVRAEPALCSMGSNAFGDDGATAIAGVMRHLPHLTNLTYAAEPVCEHFLCDLAPGLPPHAVRGRGRVDTVRAGVRPIVSSPTCGTHCPTVWAHMSSGT
jgi:hypothetical protein